MVWKRPETVQFPKKWRTFEVQNIHKKFVVKDLSEDYYDISLGYMTNTFMNESAICKPLKIFEDTTARRQMQEKWLAIMKQKMSLVCVTVEEVPRVAAIHFTLTRDKNDVDSNSKSENSTSETQYSKFSTIVQELKNEGGLFEMYGDQYLGSLGLFVVPEFRGFGIATEILKARLSMCKAFGFRGTATVFSTLGAQKAASKAGYKTIATRSTEDLAWIHLNIPLAVMGVNVDDDLDYEF